MKNKILIFHGALESNNKGCEALSLGLLRFMKEEIPESKNFKIVVYGLVKSSRVVDKVTYKPFPRLSDLMGIKALIKELRKTKIVLDIGYGDGFSDIYGFRRIKSMSFYRFLAIRYCKTLILTPQTIGPFISWKAKVIAKYILKKSKHVFSRDYISKSLADNYNTNSKIAPDLAYFLRIKNNKATNQTPPTNKPIVGLNISGLLWNNGYTGKNEFGLNIDYKTTIINLVRGILEANEYKIVLVPHSFSQNESLNFSEDDYNVSVELLKIINEPSISIIPRGLNSEEIKYIISGLDFFIGSRMHSCIASLSSNIPCLALSYSRKFQGLFTYLGYGNLEINLKSNKIQAKNVVCEVLEMIKNRESIKQVIIFNNRFVEQKFSEFKSVIINEIL